MKQKPYTKVHVFRLVLNSSYIVYNVRKFPLAYGETMTMMTPYGVIGWERVKLQVFSAA